MTHPPRSSLTWKQPEHPGEPELQRGIASAAAPVLAGFSLATIAVLLTATATPPASEWAIAAFVAAAAMLIFAMQADFHALRFSVPPATRLDAYPEARTDREVLTSLRRMQARDVVLAEHYGVLGRVGYNLGLLCFFGGLALLTYPGKWGIGSGAAFVAACTAFFTEVRWIARSHGLDGLSWLLTFSRRWLLSREDLAKLGPANLDELDEFSMRAVMIIDSDGKPVDRAAS